MRLDHLLSKEKEEVRVVLLFSYQGVSAEGRESWSMSEKDNEEVPVAMRLGETPVLIPNTKVKT